MFAVIFGNGSYVIQANDKLSPEEVVEKHLESIGNKEKRASIKDKVVAASVIYNLIAPRKATAIGKAVFASSTEKSLFGMSLSIPNYPSEKIAFNGKTVVVTDVIPGTRSLLGEFMRSYDEIVSEGLFNGVLGSNWALLNFTGRKPSLSYKGIKKINGIEAHSISYTPKKRVDIEITLYFDTANFHHIRTEYSKLIAAAQGGSIDSSAGQSANRYRLTEDFEDFQTVSGLTIPAKYTMHYTHYASAVVSEAEWEFKVNNISYNQNLTDEIFKIDAK